PEELPDQNLPLLILLLPFFFLLFPALFGMFLLIRFLFSFIEYGFILYRMNFLFSDKITINIYVPFCRFKIRFFSVLPR
ncbi:hypothetical protein, partial [Agathobacter rectalis]|uniref:hypothetical protein n=1 Tax=Agathobacter rectalis TaxID=39491 RepID=UPI0027D312FD